MGCKQSDAFGPTRPGEESWVSALKVSLNRAEKKFFTSRYIQTEDPFDLDVVMAALKDPSRGLTQHLRFQIEYRAQDFNESWPLIVDHLTRLQRVYAVTAVLPAYQIYSMLGGVTNPDSEMDAAVGELKKLAESAGFRGSIERPRDPASGSGDLHSLASRISARSLELLSSMAPEKVLADRSVLDTLAGGVLWLDVALAEKIHGGLKDDLGVVWRGPMKTLERLGAVYAKMFEELAAADREGVQERVGTLRLEEAELLKELKFVTDRQFQFTRLLTRSI